MSALVVLGFRFVGGARFEFLRQAWRPAHTEPISEPPWEWGSEGRADVCLFARTPQQPNFLEGGVALTIHGVLAAFGRLGQGVAAPAPLPGTVVYCQQSPDSQVELDGYIDIEDAKGELWRVMYGLSRTTPPGLATRPGTPVTLRFDAHWGFSRAAGFMLLDDGGPVIAVERGTFGPGLAPERRRPFSVDLGETIARRKDFCGGRVEHELQVTADERVRVLPGRRRALSLHGVGYQFWNADAATWENEQCTDMLDSSQWALWRL